MQGESKLGGTNVTLLMVADPGDFAGTGKPFCLVIESTGMYKTGAAFSKQLLKQQASCATAAGA